MNVAQSIIGTAPFRVQQSAAITVCIPVRSNNLNFFFKFQQLKRADVFQMTKVWLKLLIRIISKVIISQTEFTLHECTYDSTMKILFKKCAYKRLCAWHTALSGSLSRLRMVMQGCVSYFSMPAVKIQYGNSAW